MIDLPTKAQVYCSDGIAGLSTYIIGNPITQQVTHLVVKSLKPSSLEYLVPVDVVEDTAPHQIRLKCTLNELENMEPFLTEEYLITDTPSYLIWPYSVSDTSLYNANSEVVKVDVTVKHQNVPTGEIAVWRSAKVQATDGYIGQVDELLINSTNMQVTHLVLRERYITEHREITIPVSQIDRVFEDTIYLKLDRKGVEALSTVPIKRWSLSGNKTA